MVRQCNQNNKHKNKTVFGIKSRMRRGKASVEGSSAPTHQLVLTFLIIILCVRAKKKKGIKVLRVILINYVWCSKMA